MKKFILPFLFSISIFSQVHHNIWYGFGPFGGTVSEISTNSRGNIATMTNGGLSYYYYDWIHMYKTQDFQHTTFLGTSDTLIACDSDSLYWTADVSYHWRSIVPLVEPVKGIRIRKNPVIKFFLWSDTTIFSGGWDGQNWMSIFPGKGIINDILLNSDNTIIIATEQGVFKSSDDGNSWTPLSLPSKNYIALAGDNISPFKLAAIANDSNLVYLSSNNGSSWIATSNGLPQGTFELTDIDMNIYGQIFVGAKSGVYRTTNFGTNWGPFSDGLEYPDFGVMKTLKVNTVHCSENKVYAGTDEGLFEKSNQSAYWNQIGPNNQQCLSLGKTPAMMDHLILGTPKGVKVNSYSWYVADNYGQDGFPINALILAAGGSYALAAGIYPEGNGFIQRSTNSGFNWETFFNLPLTAGKFNNFYQRKDSTQLFLALSEGINSFGLYVCDIINSPSLWQGIPNTEGMNFQYATSFPAQLTEVYFLVNDSLIYKSDDGGRTFSYVSFVPGGKLNSIHAVDHGNTKNIYACGQGIRVSTDYGLTWEDYGLTEYEVVKLIYESYSLLAATRNNGFFAKYHSQGDWLPFSGGLGDGKVINDAMNFTSWVLHTATANHSVYFLWLIINDAGDENDLTSADNFVLLQNYPNPFNPTTKIRYIIPNVGSGLAHTELKVFDVLGNEVATLFDEEKPAGIYEVDFDAGKYGLSSGIYFYQLRAVDNSSSSGEGFVTTKKMILLR
ncbi:T9SS type A sorting domain-containing protein [Ignavibacterium album]|uniref:T9SS type A sorting domain-containing protein n=1 Tax=Ignavibacterium album TaxID=591197 RepID=UPI0035B972A5